MRKKNYIRVHSNDPVKKVAYLNILANIKPYIMIKPRRAVLKGLDGEIKNVDILITSNLEEPLEIKPVSFNLEGKVSYRIDTVEEGKQYKVSFENVPYIKGVQNGYLKIKTNYKKKPDIKIGVTSRFK